jgi:hypothetical protein
MIKCEEKNTKKEKSRNRIQYIRNASERVQMKRSYEQRENN